MSALTLYCQVFYPDEQSTSQLFADWASGLAARGGDVRVVCGFPPGEVRTNTPSREQWRGVSIRRVGVRVDFKRSIVHRAVHYAAYLVGVALELLREPNRLVLVVTNPPFLPVWAAFLRRLRKARYAIEVQDLYPDGLTAIGILHDGVLANAWRALNRASFGGSEFIIVLGRDMAERLQSSYGVDSTKIVVIPHWSPVEPEARILPELTRMFERLHLGGRFVVQYSGNMGLWHDMGQIVAAAALLQDRCDIQFLMIGDGRRREEAEREAEIRKLQNMQWLTFQPKTLLEDSLSACHVALISQREGLDGLAVPCKLYGILATGRAIIAAVPKTSETARVIEEEHCGVLVAPGDAQGLADGILHLCNNPGIVAEMAENARSAYLRLYTLDSALSRFEHALASRVHD